MPDKEKRKALYDAVSKDYDVGSYDEFSSKMDDSTKRQAFYNGVGKEYELGDYKSFESNVSVKKKDSGIVSSTPSVPTTTNTSEPKGFVQGSAPAPEGSLIKMPEQKTDESLHENDPIQSALQPHRNEYTKTLNELNNSGLGQKQVSESTGQKVKPQQMIVGGNGSYGSTLHGKLNNHIRDINNTYDKVANQVIPNVDAAKDFIQNAASKNKGVIPEDNETVQVAAQKINDFADREKTIAESGDLTSAAVNQAMKENPTLAKEVETIKKDHPDVKSYKDFLPGSMVGKLVDNFYKDKDNQDVINHHPEWKEQFDNLGKNNLTDNPEYGAVVVGNELSRARQAAGKNNPVANAIIGGSSYMDNLAKELYKNDPQKMDIYNNIVKQNFNKYIDTKDFFSSFAEGGKVVYKGIKNTFKELTGQGSDAEAAQEELKNQFGHIDSGAKGIYEYTDPAGRMTGMILAMAGTGGILKGVGAGESLANGINVGTTFWSDEKHKFRLSHPGQPLVQNIGATLMTGAYMVAPNAVPSNKVGKVLEGMRPEVQDIAEQLASGKLTREAAKSKALYAFEQALNFGKSAAKQNLKGAGEMTAITAFGQGLDKALGLNDAQMKQFHPEGELQDVAKSMLIGNAIPSLLLGAAGIKARPYTKESLYEMATNPKRFQSVMRDQMLTDPNAHANMENKLADLDHLVRTKAELDAHTELTTDQKKQYILQDYNEKILRDKAETITNPLLKSKIEDQIKKSEAIKENIFKGNGTDMLPQEDHLTSKEYKEVSDIKTDEDLFNYFVEQKKEGYKTTLKAAEDMEDKQAGIKAGVDYMKDKAIENPVLFRERWGNDITNKMLDKATTQEIGDSYHNLIDHNSNDPAIPILEKILDEREEKGDVYKPTKTEESSNAEVDETIQPAEEKQNSETIKPEDHAISVGGAAKISMDEASRNSPEVGARISGAEEPPGTQIPTGKIGESPGEENITSLKNKVVDQKRKEFGLNPAMKTARKELGKSWDEGMKKIEDGYDPQTLVDSLKKKSRPLTDVENSILLKHQIDKETELRRIDENINKAADDKDEEALAENRLRKVRLQDDLQDIYDVGKAAGTENARGLNTRKMLANDDYSLAAMVAKKRAANDGKKLSPEQMADLEKKHEEIQKKFAAYEKRISELEKQVKDLQSKKPLGKKAKEVADNIRKLKINKGDTAQANILSIPTAIWDGAVETIAQAIEKGGVLADAIDEGIKHLKAQGYLKDKKEEESFRNDIYASSGKEREFTNILHPEVIKLKADYERAKANFDADIYKDEQKKRNWIQKGADVFVKYERAGKLSWPTTLAKLVSAGVTRLVQSPIEDVIGKIPGIISPKLEAKAHGEGGFNVKAQAKMFASAFTKGIADAADIMKKGRLGKSDIDFAFGDRRITLPPEIADFFGHLHGAIKAPIKRGIFEKSLTKRIAANMKAGNDVTDPLVQTSIALDAYKDANRAIFMQDNIVADSYRNLINSIEKGKEFPTARKGLSSAMQWLIPFVKVPTNIVGETVTLGGGGLVFGGAKLLHTVFTKGIEGLSPSEADMVMRNLKKGALGSALLLVGYFNPQSFGGFYQEKEKRKEGDLKANQMKVFGETLPSWLLHAPLFNVMQLGATVRRVKDKYLAKGNKHAMANGVAAAALGLVKEVPLAEQPVEVGKLFDEKERQYYVGELTKNTIDPGILQFAAKVERGYNPWTEQTSRKADPKTIMEHVETGLPYATEQVGDKKKKK